MIECDVHIRYVRLAGRAKVCTVFIYIIIYIYYIYISVLYCPYREGGVRAYRNGNTIGGVFLNFWLWGLIGLVGYGGDMMGIRWGPEIRIIIL